MRNKLGNFFMVVGMLLLIASLALFFYNRTEAAQAQAASAQVVQQLIDQLEENTESLPPESFPVQDLIPAPQNTQMKEIEIDGQMYIGHVTIPSLSLELPVLSDWDYPKLRIAPCRYYGAVGSDDLVIMAHNYQSHFGTIDQLQAGDTVYFTDADGDITVYSVVARDVLNPYAVEEVISGDFDLTLFTCTYGGQTRVCVYCDRA